MSEPNQPLFYRFGEFELNPATRSLLKDGVTMPLRSRAFDVLLALVERAGQLLSKDDLFDRVWPTSVVEEAALNVQISALRKVLGPEAITTVSGRGYQFTWPVAVPETAAALASRRHNLPSVMTSLIGREHELAQLDGLIPAYRLVTLTGVGGVGKTRLAIEAARRMVEAFVDGVWLVELAAIGDPRLVPRAVAQVLRVNEQANRSLIETLLGHLATKKTLLVLDNAEHLLAACAEFAELTLRRCSDATILVTSRERLAILGERSYHVPSLSVPPLNGPAHAVSTYASAQLLVERAQLTRPELEVTPENASAVASICARLDGLPLAIELAASRLRALSVEELGKRLDRRFALLADTSTMAVPRHRTLQTVLDWSYELLSEPDRAMLRRSAVFVGGWTLDSVESVCSGEGIVVSDIVERLTSLVDKSLVVTEERAGSTRYWMLETVHQYATERLSKSGDEAQWRARHLAWSLELAKEFDRGSTTPEGQAWFARMDGEFENLRAAVAWSLGSDPGRGARLIYYVRGFIVNRAHVAEGRALLAQLLDVYPLDGSVLDRARALHTAATLAIVQGDDSAAERQVRESLALFRMAEDPEGSLRALSLLVNMTLEQGRYPEAEVLAREAFEQAQKLGNHEILLSSRAFLGVAMHGLGRWAEAHALLQDVLEAERRVSRLVNVVWLLNEIGFAECAEGRSDLALQRFVESIDIANKLGIRGLVIDSLDGFAYAAAARSPIRAAQLWGAVEALRQRDSIPRSIRKRNIVDQQVRTVRDSLTLEKFDQAWTQGRGLSLNAAVQLALTEREHAEL